MTIPQARLRNFCIIAHIDHGKTTLSDRLLEMTHTIDARQMTSQVLDSMDLEKEHGITIKARAVRLEYTAADGLMYGLNLIDTPGHVDFSYEVSRSLQACEGAILVVDATQGIEAQTLANVHLALKQNLTIIPVLNKIDLPSAQIDVVIEELESVLAMPREEVLLASAKDGTGVAEILEAIVKRVPPPKGDPDKPLQALIFDSHYDSYKGVIVYVRLAQGTLREHDIIRLMGSGAEAELVEMGFFRPQLVPVDRAAGRRRGLRGDRSQERSRSPGRRHDHRPPPLRRAQPLPGYQPAKSLVFAGIYPIVGSDYPMLRDAMEKLHLNDASFSFEPESSVALGFGFRCGFLGLLHMEIVQERLEREFGQELIASAPSVEYKVVLMHGQGIVDVDNPSKMPDAGEIEEIREPWVKLGIVTPTSYIGTLMELGTNRRGTFLDMEYLDPQARPAQLRAAAGRGHRRLLRPAQDPNAGLCLDGLRGDRLPGGQPGQGGRAGRRRSGRRAVGHRPPRSSAGHRARARAPPARPDPAPDVRRRRPGGHRLYRHLPRDGGGDAQERPGQVLRRRHHPQAQAAGEAEGRQAAHEAGRVRSRYRRRPSWRF